jgi:hypothetical protein
MASDFRVTAASENRYDAETTRPPEPERRLHRGGGWQKGIVAAPSDSEQWGWWISDNAGVMALA